MPGLAVCLRRIFKFIVLREGSVKLEEMGKTLPKNYCVYVVEPQGPGSARWRARTYLTPIFDLNNYLYLYI